MSSKAAASRLAKARQAVYWALPASSGSPHSSGTTSPGLRTSRSSSVRSMAVTCTRVLRSPSSQTAVPRKLSATLHESSWSKATYRGIPSAAEKARRREAASTNSVSRARDGPSPCA